MHLSWKKYTCLSGEKALHKTQSERGLSQQGDSWASASSTLNSSRAQILFFQAIACLFHSGQRETDLGLKLYAPCFKLISTMFPLICLNFCETAMILGHQTLPDQRFFIDVT